MQGQARELWEELCERAAREQDPQRLLRLIEEINHLLDEKERRLRAEGANGKTAGPASSRGDETSQNRMEP